MARINKARHWWAVLYPENMIEDWQNKIDDVIQHPYAYCVHNLDTDSQSEHRKDHVHLLVTFPNTTTYNHALSVFRLLGEKAVNTCEAVVNVRHCYDYLIHDTKKAKSDGKYQYPESCRITGNCFDIGAYEQLGVVERREIFEELCNYVTDNEITDVATLWKYVNTLDWRHREVMINMWQRFDSLTSGVYKQRLKMNKVAYWESRKKDDENIILSTTKNNVTEDGRQNTVLVDAVTGEVIAGQGGFSDENN